MLKETLILIAAFLVISFSQTNSALADDTNGTPESSQTEKQGPSDFDDWYKPDDAYPTNDQQQQATENEDKASGPDEGPFLGPGDDQRSKVR